MIIINPTNLKCQSQESWQWGIVRVWLVDGIYGLLMMLAALIYLKTGKWMHRQV
ncbi:MAG: hypothetical protein LBS03_04325 [Bacteroidales bacterium]|nr:hypothetical protein [Bacteroidales bacterium]